MKNVFKSLNVKLYPISPLIALFGDQHIPHVTR